MSFVEHRRDVRRRKHLRSGKLIDENDEWIADCVIVDSSHEGVGLRLTKAETPPKTFLLYDEQDFTLRHAELRWMRGAVIGCHISNEPVEGKEEIIARFKTATPFVPTIVVRRIGG